MLGWCMLRWCMLMPPKLVGLAQLKGTIPADQRMRAAAAAFIVIRSTRQQLRICHAAAALRVAEDVGVLSQNWTRCFICCLCICRQHRLLPEA
jgi:hypothetical protein